MNIGDAGWVIDGKLNSYEQNKLQDRGYSFILRNIGDKHNTEPKEIFKRFAKGGDITKREATILLKEIKTLDNDIRSKMDINTLRLAETVSHVKAELQMAVGEKNDGLLALPWDSAREGHINAAYVLLKNERPDLEKAFIQLFKDAKALTVLQLHDLNDYFKKIPAYDNWSQEKKAAASSFVRDAKLAEESGFRAASDLLRQEIRGRAVESMFQGKYNSPEKYSDNNGWNIIHGMAFPADTLQELSNPRLAPLSPLKPGASRVPEENDLKKTSSDHQIFHSKGMIFNKEQEEKLKDIFPDKNKAQ